MSQQSYNFQSIKTWNCKYHQDEGEGIHINSVFIGKNYEGQSRFYCQYCQEHEDDVWAKGKKEDKIKIAFLNIMKYKQEDVQKPEPRLEQLMPYDNTIKNKCRDQIKVYEDTEQKDQERLSNFIQGLKGCIESEIQNSSDRAHKYYDELKQLGEKLEDRYYEIVDCSKIKGIIDDNTDKEELIQKMQQFIIERLDNTNNNKELDKLCKEFNNKLNLYTTEQATMLREVIINYTKKMTFETKKTTAIDKFEEEVNSCMAKLKLGNGSQSQQMKQQTLFNNIKQSNYKIENFDSTVETLTSSSDECFAKFAYPIKYDGFYQFIFKITNLSQNPASKVTIGLGEKDDLNGLTHSKTFFNKNEDKCNFVQMGRNLSTPPEDSTNEIIVVLNVEQSKNKFYFTDKNRLSKNLMTKRVGFQPKNNYGLYVHSIGQFNISLLHYEHTHQQS
ncbi:hypothetical protein ABPG74_014769 [Tetrahymena malaccensis]